MKKSSFLFSSTDNFNPQKHLSLPLYKNFKQDERETFYAIFPLSILLIKWT